MKIERDKWYLDRRGDRVRVISTTSFGEQPIVVEDESGAIAKHNADGTYWPHKGWSCADIVAPAPEPVRGYVAFTRDGLFVGHAIKTEAFGPSLRILDLSTAKEVGDE
jgi:hypothetical protein